ncbi:MAG: Rpn family recombination-promoting nuclease/putative transposase, partial [Desulfovibrio sp.]|nr:Rpn family recombination-promoting nuclease/putative transposase [Desulfovibrio sp.]
MVNVRKTSVLHDASYKLLFSHPEMVQSLIRDFVPDEWVREVDFSTLEKQNGSYVADDLRERHEDILWRIKCRDTWLYIYLLIEFQSSVDPWMAVRILTYIGLLYQDLIKSGQVKGGDKLPPVFPLVL